MGGEVLLLMEKGKTRKVRLFLETIGYTTAEQIKDNIITFTDLQTDIRTLLDETEKS